MNEIWATNSTAHSLRIGRALEFKMHQQKFLVLRIFGHSFCLMLKHAF